jgi:hypothetical protein
MKKKSGVYLVMEEGGVYMATWNEMMCFSSAVNPEFPPITGNKQKVYSTLNNKGFKRIGGTCWWTSK